MSHVVGPMFQPGDSWIKQTNKQNNNSNNKNKQTTTTKTNKQKTNKQMDLNIWP